MNENRNEFDILPAMNWLAESVGRGLALVLEVMIRRGFGQRYISAHAFMAACVMLCLPLAGASTAEDFIGLWLLGWLFIMACGLQQAGLLYRWWRGVDLTDSMYNGWPILADITGLHETTVKTWVEPPLFITLGISLGQFLPMTGLTVVGCGAALMCCNITIEGARKRDVQSVVDAELRGRQLAARYRCLKGGAR